MTAILLPVSPEYYGNVTKLEYRKQLEINNHRLKAMGLWKIGEVGRGSECNKELWADDKHLELFGTILTTIVNHNGDEIEPDPFDIWGD